MPTVGKYSALIILAVAVLFTASRAEPSGSEIQFTTLAGQLPRVVSAENGPYLVIADIEVPAGKLVTIEPGTVILFKNFTGLHVQGRLVAEGSLAKPLIFTSEFDRDYNPASTMYPNPYDWNGIYIHTNAVGTSMAHCKLYYSVYGIISETKFVRVFNGLFANNGKSNLIIEGNEHTIGSGPYTYELSLKDATVDGVPIKILKDPAAPKRNTLRFASIGVFLASAGVGTFYTVQWRDSQDKLERLSVTTDQNLVDNEIDDWYEAKSDKNLKEAISIAGYCLGIVSAAGFGFSFSF